MDNYKPKEFLTDLVLFLVALAVVAMAYAYSSKQTQHEAFIEDCSQGYWAEQDCEEMWRMGND